MKTKVNSIVHPLSYRQKTKYLPYDNKDIPVNEFGNFHREMIENSKEKIKEEYEMIQTFADSLEKTCIASKANEKLNRYTNISPFDYNRVVLFNDDELENDYINASYINVRVISIVYQFPSSFCVSSRAIIILENTSQHKDQNQTQVTTSGEWCYNTRSSQL